MFLDVEALRLLVQEESISVWRAWRRRRRANVIYYEGRRRLEGESVTVGGWRGIQVRLDPVEHRT